MSNEVESYSGDEQVKLLEAQLAACRAKLERIEKTNEYLTRMLQSSNEAIARMLENYQVNGDKNEKQLHLGDGA